MNMPRTKTAQGGQEGLNPEEKSAGPDLGN